MNQKTKILSDIYQKAEKAVRATWTFLRLSLADRTLSFVRVVSVSLEAGGMDLVYAEKLLWRTTIRQCRHYPLEENKTPTPEHLASVVAGFVEELKISRASFVLIIPRAWAIVQTVELPAAAKENLSRVLSFELDRLTPLSRDNAFYHYCVLGEDGQNVKLLIAVVRADQVQQYLDALKARKIKTTKVTVSSFALSSLIRHSRPKTDAVYLSLKDARYECGVIENSLLQSSVAGPMDRSDTQALNRVVGQANVLADESIKHGRRPEMIIDAEEKDFLALRDQFKTGRVTRLERDARLTMPGQEKELPAAALGGAVSEMFDQSGDINLLNPDEQGPSRASFVLTAALLVILAAMIAFYFLMPLTIEQRKLDEMDRHLQALKPAVRKVEALKNEIAAVETEIHEIDDFKKQSGMTMDIIKDMTAILPPKTWLTRLRITEKTAEIEGYSSSATDIIVRLENSRYFQKAEFASPTFRDPRQNNERFVIKMELKNEPGKKDAKAEMKNEKKK